MGRGTDMVIMDMDMSTNMVRTMKKDKKVPIMNKSLNVDTGRVVGTHYFMESGTGMVLMHVRTVPIMVNKDKVPIVKRSSHVNRAPDVNIGQVVSTDCLMVRGMDMVMGTINTMDMATDIDTVLAVTHYPLEDSLVLEEVT